MKKLSSISVSPEKYGEQKYNSLQNYIFEKSLMHDIDRRFIFGLLEYFKPNNILEIGVAGGTGSALMLESIKERKEARLVSIDISEFVYDTSLPVGQVAMDLYPEGNSQWKLITGKDPSQVLDKLDRTFDFMVLDTAHVHPIESLNFLCALPYLSEDAIVVLHDIGICRMPISPFSQFPKTELACKILYDVLAAEKIRPKDNAYRKQHPFSNIGALQISEDTKKYINNVFTALEFPWGLYPSEDVLDSISECMKTHYTKENFDIFKTASIENKKLANTDFKTFFEAQYFTILKMMKGVEKIVLYGKVHAKSYLSFFRQFELPLPYEIWDNYLSGEVDGIPVVKPKNDLSDDTTVIFAIKNKKIVESLIPTIKANVIRIDDLIDEMTKID